MKISSAVTKTLPPTSKKLGGLLSPKSAFEGGFADELKKQFGVHAPGKDLNGLLPMRPLSPQDMIPGLKGPAQPMQDLNAAPQVMPILPLGQDAMIPGRKTQPKSEHEKLQETARKLVAQTFYGPMLKQMRDSPFKSEMFSGGRGGQAFSSMLDQHLAEHMSKNGNSKLVRAITRKLEANARVAQQQQPVSQPGPTTAPAATTVAPAAAAQSDNPNQNVRIHVAPGLRA